jgi:hypothetical protein
VGSRSLKFLVGLGVALAAFWITLQALNTWNVVPAQRTIHVTEATYGMSCGAAEGNVTEKILAICNATEDSCAFSVDVGALGDPAPGCGKDFSVSWRCGDSELTHNTSIAAEANGQRVSLKCP